jgi:hypothetical protein
VSLVVNQEDTVPPPDQEQELADMLAHLAMVDFQVCCCQAWNLRNNLLQLPHPQNMLLLQQLSHVQNMHHQQQHLQLGERPDFSEVVEAEEDLEDSLEALAVLVLEFASTKLQTRLQTRLPNEEVLRFGDNRTPLDADRLQSG